MWVLASVAQFEDGQPESNFSCQSLLRSFGRLPLPPLPNRLRRSHGTVDLLLALVAKDVGRLAGRGTVGSACWENQRDRQGQEDQGRDQQDEDPVRRRLRDGSGNVNEDFDFARSSCRPPITAYITMTDICDRHG